MTHAAYSWEPGLDSLSSSPIRVGISACLLGAPVRFDGGHKRDAFIVHQLGQCFEWVPVCPELEMGLGVPRESVRLVGSPTAPRLLASRSQRDHTAAMQHFAAARLEALVALDLHGYILKKDSPSCGLERVRVYGAHGACVRAGRGVFAAALVQCLPLLPVEEEGRLHDPRLRENFIERVFVYARWRALRQAAPTPASLVRFHTWHKLALMAHSPAHCRRLGHLVAQAGVLSLTDLLPSYEATCMEGLKILATPRKHANVLYRLLMYLKPHLDAGDKAEAVDCIEAYRQGLVPLVVPLTLFTHHCRRHPMPWVLAQTYLQPYPVLLRLRNHI